MLATLLWFKFLAGYVLSITSIHHSIRWLSWPSATLWINSVYLSLGGAVILIARLGTIGAIHRISWIWSLFWYVLIIRLRFSIMSTDVWHFMSFANLLGSWLRLLWVFLRRHLNLFHDWALFDMLTWTIGWLLFFISLATVATFVVRNISVVNHVYSIVLWVAARVWTFAAHLAIVGLNGSVLTTARRYSIANSIVRCLANLSALAIRYCISLRHLRLYLCSYQTVTWPVLWTYLLAALIHLHNFRLLLLCIALSIMSDVNECSFNNLLNRLPSNFLRTFIGFYYQLLCTFCHLFHFVVWVFGGGEPLSVHYRRRWLLSSKSTTRFLMLANYEREFGGRRLVLCWSF